MKQVIIIVRPHAYFKTKDALTENRIYAMTVKEITGRGRAAVKYSAAEGNAAVYDGAVYENALSAKKMIEIICRDDDVQKIIDIVLSVNSHGVEGDGKIFVLPVDESIRIHTGERGEDALI